MAKMDKKWVVLCTTAIGVIYSAGYITTETQAALSQPQKQIQTHTHTVNSQIKSQYKSGTFEGSGSNRRGSIGVKVTITNDKITDVEISHFAMHYSEKDVVGLPEEVIQKQSAQVQNVSGATYSTQAFQDAIENALTQARNV
ncbi:FMN-binding protein [Paenibacillus chondroitinus]|uniref:FMN-binding protein n=1 Tax=Paenibacillus chondroitinus TaxID=59842 RepID=A0ABU6D7M1_9BACL|nr:MULTISPECIES: FMN-binding protein [Paenibacillus]MCY9662456.1 FMN-binding protein [Paenibacillus anseongense]MEB4793430.1 FMN-binding protein [Paenibacillus chondroitinus]